VNKLGSWIRQTIGGLGLPDDSSDDSSLGLAVAALLVEVLRADFESGDAERSQAVASIGNLLGLDEAGCIELLGRAEKRIDQSHDLYQFTSEINRSYDAAEKLRLVEHLWRVAHADDAVHKYEEHLIRRVADLLHVPHRAFISAKLRAQ
jgi:uncharacterized tellurite resistance protein B-like protein